MNYTKEKAITVPLDAETAKRLCEAAAENGRAVGREAAMIVRRALSDGGAAAQGAK